MDPGEIITETAKALSAPVTKLLEVVAAGCGKLYEPTGIRRAAKAEGEALVIMAEARAIANEVTLRAAHRLLESETRRQRNLEAIVECAKEQLTAEVSPEPVATDWAARFFREAQDISDEQMQGLWARLLAGEVTRPGSFSARTLTVIRDLSPGEAHWFNLLCLSLVKVGGKWTPLLHPLQRPEHVGLPINVLLQLQAAGLVSLEMRSLGMSALEPLEVETRTGKRYVLRAPAQAVDVELQTGRLVLTQAGQELAPLALGPETVDHVETERFHELRMMGWAVDEVTGA